MANLAKLEFAALDITGKNYLTWVLDTKIHLEAGNLGDTIKEESNSSSQDRAKVMIFICRHLDEALKSEYLTVEDPLALWNALRNRYNHQTTQQYRARGYTEYNQLISVLLVAEQNDELLMKNHHSRPTGSAPFPEGVETNFLDQARPMDIPDPVFDLSRQLNTTHLDVPEFIVERGNEVYRSD
ncbi:uncharacterized protein [Pyrus communis]|uniref:uncharacterized protein n=1 Tax=Pyrus communis TaxID=23211 RepID=UPI0035BF00B1